MKERWDQIYQTGKSGTISFLIIQYYLYETYIACITASVNRSMEKLTKEVIILFNCIERGVSYTLRIVLQQNVLRGKSLVLLFFLHNAPQERLKIRQKDNTVV